MKQGKIAESVLKRSIFKQLHLKRPDVLLAAENRLLPAVRRGSVPLQHDYGL